MKITLRAGGVIRSGAERDLIDDYLKRANGLANRCGVHSVNEQQVDLRKEKSRIAETQTLLDGLPTNSKMIILDERGKSLTSRQFTKKLANFRDDGLSDLIIVIGGADGFEPSRIPAGTERWCFGQQTWPHKMVRIMLAEQIYRALSILAGTPYHRD